MRPHGMHQRTYQRVLRLIAYHEVVRTQGASYAGNRDQTSTERTYGGNAGTGLQASGMALSLNLDAYV